jgi:hypothetical protein
LVGRLKEADYLTEAFSVEREYLKKKSEEVSVPEYRVSATFFFLRINFLKNCGPLKLLSICPLAF